MNLIFLISLLLLNEVTRGFSYLYGQADLVRFQALPAVQARKVSKKIVVSSSSSQPKVDSDSKKRARSKSKAGWQQKVEVAPSTKMATAMAKDSETDSQIQENNWLAKPVSDHIDVVDLISESWAKSALLREKIDECRRLTRSAPFLFFLHFSFFSFLFISII